MLVVEVLGASTIILYGLNLLWDPLYDKFEDDPRQPGTPKASPPNPIIILQHLYYIFYIGVVQYASHAMLHDE